MLDISSKTFHIDSYNVVLLAFFIYFILTLSGPGAPSLTFDHSVSISFYVIGLLSLSASFLDAALSFISLICSIAFFLVSSLS